MQRPRSCCADLDSTRRRRKLVEGAGKQHCCRCRMLPQSNSPLTISMHINVVSRHPLLLSQGPTLTRVFFGAGIYFVSLNALRQAIESPPSSSRVFAAASSGGNVSAHIASTASSSLVSKSTSSFDSFVVGAAARTIAATAMSPISVVKTRAEFGLRGAFPSTWQAVRNIARVEGAASLYAGLIPTIARDAPFSGIYFMFYSHLSQW